jgi:hypothetical protein
MKKIFLLLAFTLTVVIGSAQNFKWTRHYPTDSTKIDGAVNGKQWYCTIHQRFEAYINGEYVHILSSADDVEGSEVPIEQWDITGTTFTLSDTCNNQILHATNASGLTVSLPNTVSANTIVTFVRDHGAGKVTFDPTGTSNIFGPNCSDCDTLSILSSGLWATWVKEGATDFHGTGALGETGGGGSGTVESVSGDGVDNTDPTNPVIDLSSYYTSTETDNAVTTAVNGSITYTFNNQTDDYTLTVTDFETPTWLTITKVGTTTLTVPTHASAAIVEGRAIVIKNGGTGDLTVSPVGGVTVDPTNGSYTIPAGGIATLAKKTSTFWELVNGVAIDADALGLVPDTRQIANQPLTADISIATLMDTLGVARRKVLALDQTNNNATPDTMQDITGLSFAVDSGVKYWFRFFITYTSAAGTTGSRWSINSGSAATYLNFNVHFASNGTTQIDREGLTAYDASGTVSTTSASLTGNIAIIEGVIMTSTDGTIIGRFASEIASSAIIAKAGYSFVEWRKIIDKP